MRFPAIFCIHAFLISFLFGLEPNRLIDFKMKDGTVIEGAKVLSVDNDSLIVVSPKGAFTIHRHMLATGFDKEIDWEVVSEPVSEVKEKKSSRGSDSITEFKPEHGIRQTPPLVSGSKQVSYKYVIIEDGYQGMKFEQLSNGYVEMSISEGRTFLRYYHSRSPENKESRFRGQFPGQGYFVIPDSELYLFGNLLAKFWEWNVAAEKAGLNDISKELGEFGEYRMMFYRTKHGQGYCDISIKYDKERHNFTESLESRITIFPPTAQATFYLFALKDSLTSEMQAKERVDEENKKKADEILK